MKTANMLQTENKNKRRFETRKHTQDGAKLLQTIAEKGGTPEGFYDFQNKLGAGLGLQHIQAVFQCPKRVNNLWLIVLKFYQKSL